MYYISPYSASLLLLQPTVEQI